MVYTGQGPQPAVLPSWHHSDHDISAPKKRLPFLSLGCGTHPLWWTWFSSPTAVRSVRVIAKMLSGRYWSFWLRRHCGQVPGEVPHLLSTLLQPSKTCWTCFPPHPHFLPHFMMVLNGDRDTVTTCLLDPSPDPGVMQLPQFHGQVAVCGYSVSCPPNKDVDAVLFGVSLF